MQVYDYIAVMLSIVLGLGATQMLSGLSQVIQNCNRIKNYWVFYAWVIVVLGLILQFWWAYWDYRAYQNWTFFKFVYLLSGPAVLYFSSRILVPEDIGTQCSNLVTYCFRIRRPFYWSLAIVMFFAMTSPFVVREGDFFTEFRVLQGLGLIAALAGAIARIQIVQELVAFSWLVLWLISVTVYRINPGAGL